jgi:Tfp pilus assembly protein PilO
MTNLLAVLSPREKRIALVTICVVAFAVLFKFMIHPMAVHWSRLNKEVVFQRNQYLKLNRMLEMKEGVEQAYQTYQGAILAKGSEEEEMAGFLREIEALSRPLPIEVTLVKTLPVTNAGFYKRYAIQLEVIGDTISICNLLYSLENPSSLLKVKRLQLTAKGDNSIRASMQINKVLVSP